MLNSTKIFFVLLLSTFATVGYADTKGTAGKAIESTNDSSISIKSNIVIFKLLSAPSNKSNGSLKKAGKVARTSNSHTFVNPKPILRPEDYFDKTITIHS